jgi:catechol 2,3-dioxygenase-like lactoylglutathione lyase family enzyme
VFNVIGLYVKDKEKMIEFFAQNLDFTLIDKENQTLLVLGNQTIELREQSQEIATLLSPFTKGYHLSFHHFAIITSNIDEAFNRIKKNGRFFISESPQYLPKWNKNAADIVAFKFYAPENHPLEILQFPKGKGKDCWQSKDKLFLGIDHTAISIRNTINSKFFYSLLNLEYAGSSVNYGIEQEKLDGIPNPIVKISGFKVKNGFDIETLEYIVPNTNEEINNMEGKYWFIRLKVDDFNQVIEKIKRYTPKAIKEINNHTLTSIGFEQNAILHDPDGHIIEVVS